MEEVTWLDPIRERRARFEAQPHLVEEILADGNRRMQAEAAQTMALARDAMGLYRVPDFELPEPLSVAVGDTLGA